MPKAGKNNPEQIRDHLNRMAPAAADAKLGDIIYDLIKAHEAQETRMAALLAKLDADSGVTDTDYASTLGGPITVLPPEAR